MTINHIIKAQTIITTVATIIIIMEDFKEVVEEVWDVGVVEVVTFKEAHMEVVIIINSSNRCITNSSNSIVP